MILALPRENQPVFVAVMIMGIGAAILGRHSEKSGVGYTAPFRPISLSHLLFGGSDYGHVGAPVVDVVDGIIDIIMI